MRPPAFAIVQELRAAGLRAEAYVGNGKMGDQFKYADKRGAAIAVIEGGDERARGEVTLKDLALGAELAKVGGKPRRLGGQPRGAEKRQARRPGGGNQGDAEGPAPDGRLSLLRHARHRGAERPGRGAAQAVRRARLCARGAVGAAAGGDFPRPLRRGNPPPHLHPDRSVGPRTGAAPRSHHSHLPRRRWTAKRSFPAPHLL